MASYDTEERNLLVRYNQKQVRKNVTSQFIQCRKAKKISQQKIADLIGVKRPNITRFESGSYNPTLDMMVKIAEAMDMDLQIQLVEKEK